MGVFGLMSHCLQRKSECVEAVDIIEVARQRDGIQLLVDYYSFQQFLLANFWTSLSGCSGNCYLHLLGGEYGALDAYITKLVKDLKALDIELVMFIDGAKGTCKEGLHKIDTWKKRHKNDLRKLMDLLSVLRGNKSIKDIDIRSAIRPVCLEIQILESLKECQCEVIQLPCGEADYVLAKNLRYRPKAYAIVSNDSDFCIFENCFFMPTDMFDMRGDLKLGSSDQWLPDKPLRLECGIIESAKVAQLFDFNGHENLVDMAVVMGTDFTSQHMQYLKEKLGLAQRCSISEVASWIRENGRPENHPEFNREKRKNPDFASAVEHSRKFYRLELQREEREEARNPCVQILIDGVESGLYPSNLVAMCKNFYWHRMLLEDIQSGCEGIECALGPLRSHIYHIILPERPDMVTEYGRTPYRDFDSMTVIAYHDRRIPVLHNLNKDKIFNNLRSFRNIMLHQEPYHQMQYFDKYGRRTGFSLLVLRYFLVMNTGGRNLNIDLDEFLVLVAMVFCRVEEPWYCGLCILPTVRCVTIGNWFQDIYRHAYSFLGSLLHVNHEFPHPKNIFSGAVFTAFYMAKTHQDTLRNKIGFPDEFLWRINQDMKHILGEKRHVISHLVEGIFNFNTRW